MTNICDSPVLTQTWVLSGETSLTLYAWCFSVSRADVGLVFCLFSQRIIEPIL